MAPQDRIAQVSSHLNYPQGLLAGQIAIITGAGQGVGAEAARLFANEGAKKAEAVVKSINDASPGRAIAVVGDVTDPTYVKRVVQKAAEFGNGKIHIIVNNAGYTWDGVIHKVSGRYGPFARIRHDSCPRHSTLQLVQVAAPYFRVKDGADRVIVNISSTSGIHGNPGQVNYAVGKAGMVGLTKTIAKEWGPQFGVRANTIAFSLVLTRLTAAKEAGTFITTPDGEKVALGLPSAQLAARAGGDEKDKYPDIPLRRGATPTEAARSILAVVSPLLSYVNGQTIMVTGGRNM
ncbi:short-chain dehydrogenase/reductase [Histoplasma capsulatum H143]|uniref:Short-chain dehydrogenase/reductase n=1 Tax=Ajellomyces capsulatus (strain H143) TaxID=544712 RepID=C6H1J0_AJECH|nr:short-chain dehydrogenase/reductase [Histoplasma capsulatum H143]